MKTLYVLAVTAVVMFVATSRGEDYESFRDVEDESQDYYANKVKEWRREQLKTLFDPQCLVWSRRKNNCFVKRSFGKRKVIFIFIFIFHFAF